MELIRLFVSFVKIGFTSFGGMSMIPLMQDEMLVHQWMSAEDFLNVIAIAEMTPGPFGLNCATFAGMQAGGIIGGLVAVVGILMPAYTLTMVVAMMFAKLKHHPIFEHILLVIRPICIGMLVAVLLSLCMTNYFPDNTMNIRGIGMGVGMFILIMKRKWSVPKVIVTSATLGILLYVVF